ncbi:MAG: N-acetylmuramate alpha-1-phosphate uridylyltransferase MurU, partial [Burkholderiales bacterium]
MKAMILAAGRGERMRPLTDTTPKALLAVRGKPLIVWQIEKLALAGFNEIIINHAHLGQMIEAALGNGEQFDVDIFYSPENSALETAGGIANALPLLGNDVFAVVNADVFCDYDFRDLHAEAVMLQEDTARKAHLILVNNPYHHRDGDFVLRNGLIEPEGAPRLTFSGIGIYQPQFFQAIPRGQKAPLAPLLHAAISEHLVSGEHYRGRWVDVGTPERLAQLNQAI